MNRTRKNKEKRLYGYLIALVIGIFITLSVILLAIFWRPKSHTHKNTNQTNQEETKDTNPSENNKQKSDEQKGDEGQKQEQGTNGDEKQVVNEGEGQGIDKPITITHTFAIGTTNGYSYGKQKTTINQVSMTNNGEYIFCRFDKDDKTVYDYFTIKNIEEKVKNGFHMYYNADTGEKLEGFAQLLLMIMDSERDKYNPTQKDILWQNMGEELIWSLKDNSASNNNAPS